ncbi:F-box domain-containing protein [Mycena venus]|uniref:F-box domain-containing protein n=1 Tax=Mycena venus TaxID=2733690 RepID=A0A8H6XRC8_9AGAR|nr:F-box domain-containing protein [Mycena venus]
MFDTGVRDTGYGSDADSQGNPTVFNFENNEPVKKAIRPTGYNIPVLDRQGRAICRIVHSHGWTIARISRIFNIPAKRITKAVHNAYMPRDDVFEDYDHAGMDFKKRFPEKREQQAVRTRVKIAVKSTTRTKDADDKQDKLRKCSSHPQESCKRSRTSTAFPPEQPRKRPRRIQETRPEASLPLLPSKSEAPNAVITSNESSSSETKPPLSLPCGRDAPQDTRRVSAPAHPPDSLAAFLMGLEILEHLQLFTASGFNDVAIFHTFARLDAQTMRDTLGRMFMGSVDKHAGREGMTQSELEKLVNAIRKLN